MDCETPDKNTMSSVPKIDPELMKQLDATAASQDDKVEAVIRLRPDDASQIVPAPEQTESLANDLIERVKGQVGESETHYNVFRNLGSFVVSAPPSFIRELICQPEVAAAVANRQPESAAMPPVETRPVTARKARRKSTKSKTRPAKASRKK
jgi:hypothetical protein